MMIVNTEHYLRLNDFQIFKPNCGFNSVKTTNGNKNINQIAESLKIIILNNIDELSGRNIVRIGDVRDMICSNMMYNMSKYERGHHCTAVFT